MKRTSFVAADLFCGAGGSSTGLARACESAGRKLDLTAVNHWDRAIETHSANHPAARHLCNGLDNVDPREAVGRRLDLLIASPECTHHSTARGGKPMNDQSRSTAWHVVRWAEALRPRFILVENVREWLTWGPLGENGRPLKKRRGETFAAWVQSLRSLGYAVDWRLLNAADYGDATSRVRLFVVARRGKGPIPWPEATHAREATQDLFGRRARWRAAREVIDWSLPCPSIFARKRPLKENTLRRIEAGLRRFGGAAAEPFLIALHHMKNAEGDLRSCRPLDVPVPTVLAGGTHIGLVSPFVLPTTHHGDDRTRPVTDPLPTVTGANRGEQAVCVPFILDQHSSHGPRSGDEPVPTITTTSRGIGVVHPFVMQMSQTGGNGHRARRADEPLTTVTTADDLALVRPFLIPANYGERPGQAPRTHDMDDPVPTVVGTPAHSLVSPFLVPYYGTGECDDVDDPMRTLTARDRLGLVRPDGVRVDIGFRMLQPHELAAAMGFPAGYRFVGNRGEVVKQIGNAVAVNVAYHLTRALLEAA